MILEGIVTTLNADGTPNIAPMGAVIDDEDPAPPSRLVLRPYKSSTTYANLKRTAQAVFHVTDDVELLARAAIDRVGPLPRMVPAAGVEGWILADACRWYALRLARLDDGRDRAEAEADVVGHGRIRDFFGLNRAKHAIVEAAILATRTALLPADEIRGELDRLAVLVDKTGGRGERAALKLLQDYLRQADEET